MEMITAGLEARGATPDRLAMPQREIIKQVALLNDLLRYVRRDYTPSHIEAQIHTWWAELRDDGALPDKAWEKYSRHGVAEVANLDVTHEDIVCDQGFILTLRERLSTIVRSQPDHLDQLGQGGLA
jgi:hypothetical protein